MRTALAFLLIFFASLFLPAKSMVRDLVAPPPPPKLEPIIHTEDGRILKTAACMNFCDTSTDKAEIHRDIHGNDSPAQGVEWRPTDVYVTNGRDQTLSLHPNGFQLIQDPFRQENLNFLDKDEVIDHYYAHCEEFLARYLSEQEGCSVQVRAFDHNIRKQIDNEETQRPLALVHGDYTQNSGPRRIDLLSQVPKSNDVLKDRLGSTPLLDPSLVRECLDGKRRFALINIWRSIDRDNVVENFPLACIDAQTQARSDLRILELHYVDRVGENYLCCPNEHHSWVYFPSMTFDEVLLIKQWDSAGALAQGSERDEPGLSSFAIHSGFLDPTSPSDARPRQSIEVRCVAIW